LVAPLPFDSSVWLLLSIDSSDWFLPPFDYSLFDWYSPSLASSVLLFFSLFGSSL